MSKAIASNSVEAAIRAHFGLTQAELARYLGVTRGQVAHVEAGRRSPSSAHTRRLWPLVALLPPPEGHGAAAPLVLEQLMPTDVTAALLAAMPDFGALPARPIRARHRAAGAQAAALRWELHKKSKRQALQSRRQWGVTVLQAAVPEVADASERARFEQWVQTLAADVAATAPAPLTATAHALAVLRLMLLEAEVAALAQLLQGATQ